MSLWNNILPEIVGLRKINFTQAIEVLILSKILFGGFSSRFGCRVKENCKEKFAHLSTEEKDKFKT